ncbi:MAG: putative Ig domain-containing protein, partial [bacterium]|nr:putative Ig domain-containing protein [bacterium]
RFYNVSDAAGNAAVQVTRTVNVVDNIAPVITLVGDNPLTLTVGQTYVEPGATALDNVNGNLTANIVITGNVNTGVVGTYTRFYNVSDAAGNAAVQVTRTVNVVAAPPTLAVTGFTLINATTDLPVPGFDPIPADAVLNLAQLPSGLNVRANVTGNVNSVRFGYNQTGGGAVNPNFRTENTAPYSLFSDSGGNYAAGTFTLGAHTLIGTPFTLDNAAGTAGTAVTLNFTVINQVVVVNQPPVVTNPGDRSNTVNLAITPLQIVATDAAGQTLTYQATGLPAGLTMSATGLISGTPTTVGSNSVTVTVTDNGSPALNTSVTFSWTITPATTVCGLSQEAEAAQRAGAFAVVNAANASGGQYVAVPNGAGSSFSVGSASRLTFCFNVTQAGTYRLKGLVNAPTGNDNSFFVSFGGTTNNWTLPTGTAFVTDYVGNQGGPDPREVTLAVGETQVVVFLREDGSRLDKLELELVGTPPANMPPVVTNPGDRINTVNAAITPLQIVATDTAGQTLTYQASGLPAGLSINPASGLISGTPTTVGTTSVTVTVSDNATPSLSASVTFSWTITPVTTVCGLSQEAEAAQRAGAFTVVSAANASGGQYVTVPNGTGNIFTANSPSRLTFCFNVTQAGSYRLKGFVNAPNSDDDSFFVTFGGTTNNWTLTRGGAAFVVDYVGNQGGPDPRVVNLPVGETQVVVLLREDGARLDRLELELVGTVTDSQPPVVAAPAVQDSAAGVPIAPVQVSAFDADGNRLTYSAEGLPAGLSIDPNTGVISGAPAAVGDFVVTVQAMDSSPYRLTSEATITWSVDAPNRAPEVLPLVEQISVQFTPILPITVQAYDPDGNVITFSAVGLPEGVVIDPTTGVVSGTPLVTGVFSVTITVTDNGTPSQSRSFTFVWTINAPVYPPEAQPILPPTPEGTPEVGQP